VHRVGDLRPAVGPTHQTRYINNLAQKGGANTHLNSAASSPQMSFSKWTPAIGMRKIVPFRTLIHIHRQNDASTAQTHNKFHVRDTIAQLSPRIDKWLAQREHVVLHRHAERECHGRVHAHHLADHALEVGE
jgi:hypothetical protein